MRRLVICTTCKFSAEEKFAADERTGGAILIAALREVLAARARNDVEVIEQACLWNCTKPCSVLFQDDARYSYITGGHAPTFAQAEAIVDWFDLHGATADGAVPFRQWPQAMKGHFIARMPPTKQ